MEAHLIEQAHESNRKDNNCTMQTNYGVLSLVSNLSRSLKILKMRTLEAEASTQAVTSLLDDASVARSDMSRKNDIAQSGLNDGLMEVVKQTYSAFEILRPIESEYAIQEETRRLLESEAKVEALRKCAIEERLRHEEERSRCREYQRLYAILHEQMGDLNSRIESLKAQLSVVQSELELSKTKFKEAEERSSFQKESMEALQLRLQDDRKYRRTAELENALLDERKRHEHCQQTLIKTKVSEKQALKLQRQAEEEKADLQRALAEEREKSKQLLEQCEKLSTLCSLMEAEQVRRQQLQIQSTHVQDMEIDIPQKELLSSSEQSSEPASQLEEMMNPPPGASSSEHKNEHPITNAVNAPCIGDCKLISGESIMDKSTSLSLSVERQDMRVEPENVASFQAESELVHIEPQIAPTTFISLDKGQSNESFPQKEDLCKVSKMSIVDPKIKGEASSERSISTSSGHFPDAMIEESDVCVLEKNESNLIMDPGLLDPSTGLQLDVQLLSQSSERTNDNGRAQSPESKDNDVDLWNQEESDISKHEDESEKVLIEASKQCMTNYVKDTGNDADSTLNQNQIKDIESKPVEDVNSILTDVEFIISQEASNECNPESGPKTLDSQETVLDSQETVQWTDTLGENVVTDVDLECNQSEPRIGLCDSEELESPASDHELRAEVSAIQPSISGESI